MMIPSKTGRAFYWLLVSTLLAGLFALPAGVGRAQHEPQQPLDEVAFDQNLDAQVPLELTFVDESGREVRLGEYFDAQPVILVFAYYECPMLCTLVLNELVRSLKELDFKPGADFQVVVVSIDPRETPALAQEKKDTYLAAFDRPGTEGGWHFLTGEQANIEQLTQVVGFRFFYDEEIGQYAHPAGLTMLTPDGRISRYFFGLTFESRDLRLGLLDASQSKIGNVIDQVVLYCYAYDPETGTYGLLIQNVLQLAGAATVLTLGGVVGAWVVKEQVGKKRAAKRPSQAGAAPPDEKRDPDD